MIRNFPTGPERNKEDSRYYFYWLLVFSAIALGFVIRLMTGGESQSHTYGKLEEEC